MPRHHHHEPPPPPAYCCCGCDAGGCGGGGCYYPAPAACYYYPAPPPPPPPAPTSASDHLLHAIAAHLLLGSTPQPPTPPPPQPQPQTQPPPPPPPTAAAPHYAFPYPYHHHQQQPNPHPQQQPQADHGHIVLHSLLRRVAALESTLPHHRFTSPPLHRNPRHRRATVHRVVEEEEEEESEEEEYAPPSPPPPLRAPRRARGGPSSAARERAARTIQAHFRRFLARRSRTLRHLKELALLRSKAAALRGSLSGRRGAGDPAAISVAAMGLLFHLDAIQGGDPMIREGKRAVSRELTRILEFVDKVLVKENGDMAMSGALECKDYHEGCNSAFVANPSAMTKKKVSFCGNGKVQEIHEEAEQENVSDAEDSSETSSSAEADERKHVNGKNGANGKPGLAPPMPVTKIQKDNLALSTTFADEIHDS
uniref:BAG domain-containing protein n=1 Tax=Leersia perrieri TaxID=77586 RepID=A0A0D9WIK0_9ORYZ